MTLKDMRVSNNLTMLEVGNLIGFTKGSINNLEKGRFQPKASIIIKLAEIYKVNISDIITALAKLENEI